ncbi:MAG: DUF4175 domain-containing protein [Verrucomicrobia bacterium]|nr:DUF4175 domain-containing protein [Verrucomicrobiota bacterium]
MTRLMALMVCGELLGIRPAVQAQASTNVLNDGRTLANLTRLQNQNGTSGGEILLAPNVADGTLMAEQTSVYSDFPIQAAWVDENWLLEVSDYTVSAEVKPAANSPERRVGVLGWFDPATAKGIGFRIQAGTAQAAFQVTTIDLQATDGVGNDSTAELYNLDGTPAREFYGSAWSPVGDYNPGALATVGLAFRAASGSEKAILSNATARVSARVFQGVDTEGKPQQLGTTVELLTTLPVPGPMHRFGYYASWGTLFVAGGPIGSLDNLTLIGRLVPLNQPPVVALTAPTNDSTFTSPATFVLRAQASDPDGTVQKVEFLRDGQLLGAGTGSPPTFTVANLLPGTYRFTARATDNGGAVTESAPIAVLVKKPNELPTVAIASPEADATYTAPAQVLVTTQAEDADGTVVRVELLLNGDSLLTTTNLPAHLTLSNLVVGTYTLVAKATDDAGGVGTSPTRSFVVVAPGGGPVSLKESTALPSAADFQQFRFAVVGTPGTRYEVEATSDFATWTQVDAGVIPSQPYALSYPRGGSKQLFYRLKLLGQTAPEPQVESLVLLPDPQNFQQLRLVVSGLSGATIRIESSSDLLTWTTVTNVSVTGATQEFTIDRVEGAGHLFYRARLGP